MAIKIKGQEQPKAVKTSRQAKAQPAAPPKARQQSFASYYTLVKKFPLESIRNDAHLSLALALVEELLKRDLDESADSYLNVLTILIETYESKAFPIPDASEADVLRELMRQNGLSQSSLKEKVGIAQPTISAVLRGERGLTKAQVVALARFFHVSPGAFLRAT